MDADVEVTHREAAELVRRHLVCIRGGAPFLSSADGALLISWLEANVPIHRILCSIEAAAAARHRTNSRVPLALTHARRHLKASPVFHSREPRPLLAAEPSSSPLAPIIEAVRAAPYAAATPEATAQCCHTLAHLDVNDLDALTTQAIAGLGTWIDAVWTALGPDGRAPWIALAHEHLADVLDHLDESRVDAMIEEYARGRLRAAAPGTSAADVTRTVWS